MPPKRKPGWLILILLLVIAPKAAAAVTITDDAGRTLDFLEPPQRIVSLIPSATEIICALGADSLLAGVTYNDIHLAGTAGKPIVGGASDPAAIKALGPDLLLLTPEQFQDPRLRQAAPVVMVWNVEGGLAKSSAKINSLAALINRTAEARKLQAENQALLDTLARKIALIPVSKRLRTVRVMAGPGGQVLSPGADSFQIDLLRAAGGLPPDFGKGRILEVNQEQWQAFNPQVVYGCSADRPVIERITSEPGWSEVAAFQDRRIIYLPCALTDRAAAHTGHFTAWLASLLYSEQFAQAANLVHPEEILGERPLETAFDYVERVRIVEIRVSDFVHRTLLLDFKNPQAIVSTLDGPRDQIVTIGNSYSPAPAWAVNHRLGLEASRARMLEVLGLPSKQTSLLFTGADLNNLAVKSAAYEDLLVTVLVTAGVDGNALRTSKDAGAYYEPGTINIIALTNRRLSPRAMTRAIITITEAKTAALWDMDIRSSASPFKYPATGTGTDEIIVAAGQGALADNTGGHAKLGELLAQATYAGVREAIWKQNGKLPERHVLKRLNERGLTVEVLFPGRPGMNPELVARQREAFAARLTAPGGQGFLQAAFSLSDAQLMGQVSERAWFDQWALEVAGEMAGRPVVHLAELPGTKELPPLLATALNALAAGLEAL